MLVTERARECLQQLCADFGPQAVYLMWPDGVTCLPMELSQTGAFDVIIAHIDRCPVYSDVHEVVELGDPLLIDAAPDARPGHLPRLQLRPPPRRVTERPA